MDSVNNENLKCNKSVFESMPSYRMIEGIYIQDRWMNHKDYPEPPDEKEQPTTESKNMYDRYRSELQKFSLSRIEECRALEGN